MKIGAESAAIFYMGVIIILIFSAPASSHIQEGLPEYFTLARVVEDGRCSV